MITFAVALTVQTSCSGPESSLCRDGLLCPFDTQCIDVAEQSRCVSLSCGDGVVDDELAEVCDDGNNLSGDGCSADCLSDAICGDGSIDGELGEVCDDGNTVSSDGCTACQRDDFADDPCPSAVLGDHAYLFCRQRSRSWPEARDNCVARGYHLVTVDDAAENEFLREQVVANGFGDWWLGYNDRDAEGSFSWVDGSPPGFENWDSGQPNGDAEENCAVLAGNGEWSDRKCLDRKRFICESP